MSYRLLDKEPRTLDNDHPVQKYVYDIFQQDNHCRIYIFKLQGSLCIDFRQGCFALSAMPDIVNKNEIAYLPVSYEGVYIGT